MGSDIAPGTCPLTYSNRSRTSTRTAPVRRAAASSRTSRSRTITARVPHTQEGYFASTVADTLPCRHIPRRPASLRTTCSVCLSPVAHSHRAFLPTSWAARLSLHLLHLDQRAGVMARTFGTCEGETRDRMVRTLQWKMVRVSPRRVG